jgi:hypothetical protein
MIGNMAFLLIKITHSLEIYLSIVSDWLRIQETTWLLKFQDIIFNENQGFSDLVLFLKWAENQDKQ